jgi:hypothetical protein
MVPEFLRYTSLLVQALSGFMPSGIKLFGKAPGLEPQYTHTRCLVARLIPAYESHGVPLFAMVTIYASQGGIFPGIPCESELGWVWKALR